MPSALLAVKFFIPKPSTALTDRAQLLGRFAGGLMRPLTLISAPAGFGKSTLLSAGIDQQNPSQVISWLSIDSADNHPSRFWIYMIAAVRAGLQKSGKENGSNHQLALDHLLEFAQSDPPPAVQPMLDEFINVISGFGEPVLLVLDDYHEIQLPAIHEQITYLLDHQPPNLRLVISTRADPPLPITRLRARNQLSEFRAADLHFTSSEAEQFFQTNLGIQLKPEDIAAIMTSTEGWIAGLQMAALALQAQASGASGESQAEEQAHQFIRSFSGKNIYVMDYLAEEVLNRQSEEVQAFLLKTSVLDRFCAGLCDDLLGPDENGSFFSEEILSYLEKTNLFLIALDQERQWFRYHHLFADILRVRLDHLWPGLRYELQRKASEWYEKNGMMEEAIHYAISAQDWERAAGLMEREIQSFLEIGQLSKVMELIALLPKDVAARRIQLLFQQAYVVGLAHRMKEFVPLLAAEEQSLEALERDPGADPVEVRRLRCNLSFQQGYYAIARYEPEKALQLAEEGLRILPPGCPWEESWLLWTRAYANRSLNRLAEAVDGFEQAFQATQKHGNLWTDMVCLTDLAMVHHLLGDLQKACDIYFKALELGKSRGAAGHSYLNRVEGWLSLILIERNDLLAASEHARAGLALSQFWPSTNTRSVTFIVLAKIDLVKGDLESAGRWLEQAELERQKSPLMPVNNSLLDYHLVRYWLASGNIAAASQWIRQFNQDWKNLDSSSIFSETQESQWIAVARVLIVQGKSGDKARFQEALELLKRIEYSARSSRRVNSLVEVLALKAVVLQLLAANGQNNHPADPAALQALEESLTLGEPGGYVRVFVDEGPSMAQLLYSLRLHRNENRTTPYSITYLETLLAAFPTEETFSTERSRGNLPEQLTDRELEVLQLMANGLSNKELAEKLVLSEGTIKTHIHNIIGKLDAQSRTQAIARARELRIL